MEALVDISTTVGDSLPLRDSTLGDGARGDARISQAIDLQNALPGDL
jgi:hypothetical protein